jgi:hypothetical protein
MTLLLLDRIVSARLHQISFDSYLFPEAFQYCFSMLAFKYRAAPDWHAVCIVLPTDFAGALSVAEICEGVPFNETPRYGLPPVQIQMGDHA